MARGVEVAVVREISRHLRWLLVAFCVLTLLGFTALYVLSEQTEQYFAWTITPPLSAAFLGAGYGAGFVLVALSLRTVIWHHARVAVLTILAFVLLTLLATLLHLDRFHFSVPLGVPRAAAWFWTAVYVTIPTVMLVLVPAHERTAGAGPQRRSPLPRPLRWVLAVQGLIMLGVGAALFVAPAATAPVLWPWELSPLAARAIASWLLAFGLAAGLALREGDLERLEIAAVAYAVFGVLELTAVARYAGDVRWGQAVAWSYVALLVSITLTGGYGWWAARRARPGP